VVANASAASVAQTDFFIGSFRIMVERSSTITAFVVYN